MKKYPKFLLMALFAMLSISIISCGNGKRYDYDESADTAVAIVDEVREVEPVINPDDLQYYIGTWEYTPPNNQDGVKTIKFIVNDDKTVQAIVNKNGKEITVYGSYDFYSHLNPPQLGMHFNDTEEHVNGILYIDHLRVFKGYNDYFGIKYGYITNGSDGHLYLYENGSQADAKNPNKRVELTKIN